MIRCYSLSDSYHENYYRVSIKKAPPPPNKPDAPWGLSSSFFHEHLREGDILDVKAPSGQFYLNEMVERPVVLIGGGVGLTPMVSMLNHLIQTSSKREIWFFYGVRNSSEHAMKSHLQKAAEKHDNIHLQVVYQDVSEQDVRGQDYHHQGFICTDLFKQLLPSNNYEFYLCGPPPMMTALTTQLSEWGVPDADVYMEAFGPASVKKKKSPIETESLNAPVKASVTFAKSGKTLEWSNEYDSLLEMAEENDIELESGCRAGNCGTCLLAIREGEVELQSDHDAAPEAGSCLACISTPKGNLVLDA